MSAPCCFRILALTAALAAGGAIAQTENLPPTPPAAASAPATLPEIRVRAAGETETATGPVTGYAAKRSATATKTDTPLIETPQPVTVISRERITDQGATGLQDALNYAAGVRSDTYGLDSRSDGFAIRGADAAVYLDGLRQQLGGYYTSTTRTEPYTLERIEVLRGPAGILFGQGSTGGLVNMVSKRPLAERQGEIGVQFGSFGRKQVQADLTGAATADGQWLYRLVALSRKSGTQVDYVDDDRLVFAPSLTWRPSAATSLTLLGLWQSDDAGSTAQFLPWSGTAAPNPNGRIPTHRFVGEPGFDKYDSDRRSLGWAFEHRLSERLTLRQNLRVSNNENRYFGTYGDFYSAPQLRLDPYVDADQRLLARAYFGGLTRQRVTAADQHVEGRHDIAGMRHQWLLGLDVLRARQDGDSIFDFTEAAGGGVPSIDAFTPVYTGYTAVPATRSAVTTQKQLGLYLQDQISVADHWRVVLGLRRDRASSGVEGSADEKSAATTQRAALLYAAPSGWSPYVSYSESFTPIAGVDLSGQRFKPQSGEQVELGLKWQAADGRVNAAAAVFDLKEKNRLVSDPSNPLNSVQGGETRKQGVELELSGRVAQAIDLSAHYNFIEQEADAADARSFFSPIPRHQASVWGKVRFTLAGMSGWQAGLGARGFSGIRDGSDAPPTDKFALLDALLAYDTGPWRAALNVQNLTDKRYFPICLDRGDCFEGARRNAQLTVTHRF